MNEESPRGSRGALIVALIALGVAVTLWIRTDRALNQIRERQQSLAGDVARLTRTPLIDIEGAPTLGPADARVVLIEFSDYECPFCIRHTQQTMPLLEERFIRTGRIRYVFRDFPIDQLHPEAIRAHEAARCADEQNRFWEMHRRLFSAPGTHTPAALDALAAETGLDMPKFKVCLESGRMTAAIRETANVAVDLGASGTPAFFVGVPEPSTDQIKVLRAISGAQPFDVFAKTIEEVFKEAEK